MTGGAVRAACQEVREEVLRRAAGQLGVPMDELELASEAVVGPVATGPAARSRAGSTC